MSETPTVEVTEDSSVVNVTVTAPATPLPPADVFREAYIALESRLKALRDAEAAITEAKQRLIGMVNEVGNGVK